MIIVSVNIYKSIATLEKQLETIKHHLEAPYVVILNCNQYMYDELKNKVFDEKNIYINPEIIEKDRFHGTLTKGIVSNMEYALRHFEFKYFLIFSGRTIMYRSLSHEQLDEYFSKKIWSSVEEFESQRRGQIKLYGWHWPIFKTTKLAQYYIQRNYKLDNGPHEGVCFSKSVCKTIVDFLANNIDISNELYARTNACVEEFALHTIASNEYNATDRSHGFVYFGNGCDEKYDQNDTDKYTRKILFLT